MRWILGQVPVALLDRPFRSAADARFLAEAVEAIWRRVQNGPWRTDEDRSRFRAAPDRAVAAYEGIIQGGGN